MTYIPATDRQVALYMTLMDEIIDLHTKAGNTELALGISDNLAEDIMVFAENTKAFASTRLTQIIAEARELRAA